MKLNQTAKGINHWNTSHSQNFQNFSTMYYVSDVWASTFRLASFNCFHFFSCFVFFEPFVLFYAFLVLVFISLSSSFLLLFHMRLVNIKYMCTKHLGLSYSAVLTNTFDYSEEFFFLFLQTFFLVRLFVLYFLFVLFSLNS